MQRRMTAVIERNLSAIIDLCRQCRVQRLEVFGSAAREDFNDSLSDVDFFYEFDPADSKDLADRFFSLQSGLQTIVGRPVDLVSLSDVKNPYFLGSVSHDRRELYAA
jgi:hypothetical protein